MGLISSAYARLSRPDAVRGQVLAHLFLARVHNLVKSSYERYLASPIGESGCHHAGGGGQHAQPIDWQLGCTCRDEPHRIRPVVVPQSRLTRRRLGDNKLKLPPGEHHEEKLSPGPPSRSWRSGERAKWDWRGFPSLWWPLQVYDWASTGWMGLASLKTIFREQLDALVDPLSRWLLNGRPGNCLLMGRMARPFGISEFLTVLLASYHLGWRLVQARAKRNRLITMIVFLLASDRDSERVYASLDESGGEQFAHLDRRRRHHLLDDRGDEPMRTQRTSERTWAISRPRAGPAATSPPERLFRQVMCYQVHRNQRVYFRLRPNRTREARTLLGRRFAAVSIVTVILFSVEFAIGLVLMLVCLSSDYRYARTYPGCNPLLDERLARGELTYLSSVTLSDHHLLSAFVDLLGNGIFWLDSGMSLTFVLSFTHLLNYDLLLYWSELNRKLESLAQRSKYAHLSRVSLDDSRLIDDDDDDDELNAPASLPDTCRLESMRALERDIEELQFEMVDFFHQVRRVDMIVGDTLTHAFLIWLSGCAFVNYNLLMNGNSSMFASVLMEMILILGFSGISITTYHLLELRRRCLRSYQTLCTLMAYYRMRKKRTFIKLLDFYLDTQNSTTYHLCRTYAYEPKTFITIIGWSFSCFFIAFTLFKPHSNISPPHQAAQI